MILTDGARILKTPTYHVFDLYKVHHDATLLKHKLTSDWTTVSMRSISQGCMFRAPRRKPE
jgi:alpha-L-arabinofuranosidase